MKSFLKKYWEIILLTSILLLGSYLRLYKIADYMTFLGDEGRDVLVVKRMLVDHKFTLLGPTASVGGFFLGPIYYYFMLPFLWLWRLDPSGPAVMVALFGIATIYLVYRLGKDLCGSLAGLVAASLYTVSPIVIAYSRSSWNPNLVPFFSALLIYLLSKCVSKTQKITSLGIGIALGIGLQLHYLFLFLLVLTLTWIIWKVDKSRVLNCLVWVGFGFILGYSPFLVFELRHNFPNTQSILRFMLAGKETGVATGFLTSISEIVFRLFGRLVYRLPQQDIWDKISGYQLWLWINGTRLAIILSLSAVAVIALQPVKFVQKRLAKLKVLKFISSFPVLSAQLLLLWFVVVIGLFIFYKKGIYDYYLGIIFPLPFLLTGLLWEVLFRQKFLRWLAVGLWLGLLILNWQGRPFRYPPNRQLAQAKMIAGEALDKTGGKPFNFALVTDFNSDHAYRYFFEIWGNPPVTIENFALDPERRSVTNQLIVICEKSDCRPLGHPLWEIAGFGQAEIVGSWDVSFVKIYKLVHYQEKASGKLKL